MNAESMNNYCPTENKISTSALSSYKYRQGLKCPNSSDHIKMPFNLLKTSIHSCIPLQFHRKLKINNNFNNHVNFLNH